MFSWETKEPAIIVCRYDFKRIMAKCQGISRLANLLGLPETTIKRWESNFDISPEMRKILGYLKELPPHEIDTAIKRGKRVTLNKSGELEIIDIELDERLDIIDARLRDIEKCKKVIKKQGKIITILTRIVIELGYDQRKLERKIEGIQ